MKFHESERKIQQYLIVLNFDCKILQQRRKKKKKRLTIVEMSRSEKNAKQMLDKILNLLFSLLNARFKHFLLNAEKKMLDLA